ncbi:MAG: saccharopine dehydrogenase NADP-binding domain-containing protein [Synergistales bacterium]|nr:saccharopine dehydrogenase NADP-binding domain-containing protein [Synergistales bacterium]
MKRILVLGAGRVAAPCVDYLARQKGLTVTVADISAENLAAVTAGTGADSLQRDAGGDPGGLLDEVRPDIVVNLLPPELMAPYARACCDRGVHLVHPAYLDDDTRSMAEEIKGKGLVFVTELGLDPGIDHMSAARTIDTIHGEGGQVERFLSVCGALPAPEANTNPWGYKLSWAPASLVGASKRTARVLLDGAEHRWPDGETFEHVMLQEVPGLGVFELYANADSIPYIEAYGIPEVRTILRGTLRYPGWCETICAMNSLGLFDETTMDLSGLTYRGFLASLLGVAEDQAQAELRRRLGLKPYAAVLLRLQWLGLVDDRPLRAGLSTPRDVVASLFAEKLVYRKGERDLVVLMDEFTAFFPNTGERERFRSLLTDSGTVGEATSIARTTGIPPAIAARFIAEGRIATPGLHMPTLPEIYTPVLAELEREGIALAEERHRLS